MAIDVNDIKAGEYELVALQWDQPTSEPGKPFTFKRHRAGARVSLDEAEARRLVLAGAVVEPGSRERALAQAALAQAAAALALLSPDARQQLLAQAGLPADAPVTAPVTGPVVPAVPTSVPAGATAGADEDDGGKDDTDSEPPKRPAQVNPKALWVDYAVKVLGFDEGQAESLSKPDLITAVKAKEAELAAVGDTGSTGPADPATADTTAVAADAHERAGQEPSGSSEV